MDMLVLVGLELILITLIVISFLKTFYFTKDNFKEIRTKSTDTDINYRKEFLTRTLVSFGLLFTLLIFMYGSRQIGYLIPGKPMYDCGCWCHDIECNLEYDWYDTIAIIQADEYEKTDRNNLFRINDYGYADSVYYNFTPIALLEGDMPNQELTRQWVQVDSIFGVNYGTCSPSYSIEEGKYYLIMGRETNDGDLILQMFFELPGYDESKPFNEQNQDIQNILNRLEKQE